MNIIKNISWAMGEMEYYYLIKRLKNIRVEIEKIKNQPINNIKDRIQVLKETNDLLREQNRILVMRQGFLNSRNQSSELLKTG